MRTPPNAPPRPAPATMEWRAGQLTTIRPGLGIGPLLQKRTLPDMSPGQVARRDLARYYLLIGATDALPPHGLALLVKTADLPIAITPDLTPSARLALIATADAGETLRAAGAVPVLSPFLRPEGTP